MNEELFPDDEVTRLKRCIEYFKKYDNERKEYYAKAMVELGQLRSYVQEIEESEGDLAKVVEKLRTKLANQSRELHRLNSIIEVNKYPDMCYDEAELRTRYLRIKELAKRQSKVITKQRNDISDLIYKLNKLENLNGRIGHYRL